MPIICECKTVFIYVNGKYIPTVIKCINHKYTYHEERNLMKYKVKLILQDIKTVEIEANSVEEAREKIHTKISEEYLDVGYDNYLISTVEEVQA